MKIYFNCFLTFIITYLIGHISILPFAFLTTFFEFDISFIFILLDFTAIITIFLVSIKFTIKRYHKEKIIMNYKLSKEISEDDLKKFNINKQILYNNALNLFNDFHTFKRNLDDSIKNILSENCYTDYIQKFDENNIYNNSLTHITNFGLTTIKDVQGVLHLKFDFLTFQNTNIKLLNRFYIPIKNNSFIHFELLYIFTPIINDKNCKNCGSVLTNSYKCNHCSNLLEYQDYHFVIDKINIVKQIDRW